MKSIVTGMKLHRLTCAIAFLIPTVLIHSCGATDSNSFTLPAAAGLSLWVVRTFLEDRTLQKGLEGYTEYAQKVRWRLIPHIW